jgi:hypothetical protein
MGLTEGETRTVWTRMAEAEVRSLYFANLASRYTKRKQIITGISFFLSSGAAATLVAKTPSWVPLLLSSVVALATAYSISIGLDRYIQTLSNLHSEWNQLYTDYEHLWNHWSDDDADSTLATLLKKARDASEIATGMPYDEGLIKKWSETVYSRFAQTTAALETSGQ